MQQVTKEILSTSIPLLPLKQVDCIFLRNNVALLKRYDVSFWGAGLPGLEGRNQDGQLNLTWIVFSAKPWILCFTSVSPKRTGLISTYNIVFLFVSHSNLSG